MIGGFALVAWPAEYGESGVMTFIVNQQGRVYQKDLGPPTAKTTGAMQSYDPDKTWPYRRTERTNDLNTNFQRLLIAAAGLLLTGCGTVHFDAPPGQRIRLLTRDDPTEMRVEHKIWYAWWGGQC